MIKIEGTNEILNFPFTYLYIRKLIDFTFNFEASLKLPLALFWKGFVRNKLFR